jgi:hypothetical protein
VDVDGSRVERRFATALILWGVAMGPTGCGDSGTPTSISADPGSLAFVVDKSSPFVAGDQGVAEQSQSQAVTIDFVGDGVVAGYAPGVMPPDWLSIETATATADTATFVLKATAAYMSGGGQGGYTLGSHDAVSMRFATGRLPENQDLRQATQIVYVDVPVTFSVVGFTALPTSLSFAGTVNTAGILAPLSFQLDGALPVTAPYTPAVPVEWTASTDQPWLTLMTSSGTTTPAGVSVAPDTTGLAAGVYQANVTVIGGGLLPLKVPVTLTLTAP